MIRPGKFIGCILIVVGSAIGAGILALPMRVSGAGFTVSVITMLIAWVILTITGLLIIEVNLALPNHSCSFSSMAEKTLGTPGKIITWISYLLLLCSIVASYMAGESSLITYLLQTHFHIDSPDWLNTILFTITLGTAVFLGTRTVDHLNRGLISIKGMLLFTSLILLLPNIDITTLLYNQNFSRLKYLFAATPVFLHIFNYHFVIPSIRIYIGEKPKALQWIVILGTTTSLIFYILWISATLGIVPTTGEHSFSALALLDHPADTPDFITLITTLVPRKWVIMSLNGFFNVSMATSFLGVSLGLFDFLADGCKFSNTITGRLQTTLVTFGPPLLFALFYPNGFIVALNYAASFIAILCIVLPALMVYKLRKDKKLNSPYKAIGNNAMLITLIIIGVGLFILSLLTNLHFLPTIT